MVEQYSYILIGLVCAAIVVVFGTAIARAGHARRPQFALNDRFLEAPQLKLFRILRKIVDPRRATVFARVNVGTVVQPAVDLPSRKFEKAQAQLNGKQFDFVICGRGRYTTLCAIKLRDRGESQRPRNAGVSIEQICEDAGVAFLKFDQYEIEPKKIYRALAPHVPLVRVKSGRRRAEAESPTLT